MEQQKKKKKCALCNKKVGLFGFICECNKTFCSLHRLPEQHGCNIKENILKKNMIDDLYFKKIEKSKIEKI